MHTLDVNKRYEIAYWIARLLEVMSCYDSINQQENPKKEFMQWARTFVCLTCLSCVQTPV